VDKASKGKKKRKKGSIEEVALRAAPNWPLFGLALIGIGITTYLTISSWTGQVVAGCTADSGCDLVLNSRWATLFGLPTSFWGFLAYASLAGIAFIKRSDTHWKLAWVVSLFGVLYSAYLTGVSFIELDTTCPYCLTSAALMIAIVGTVTYQRPDNLAKFSWGPWFMKTIPSGIVIVLALHFYYSGTPGTPAAAEDPKLSSLVDHLVKIDAKFYGAFWCPHCKEQKRLFGASADRLPYIECSPHGRRGPQSVKCQARRIRTYPTWIIDNRRYPRFLTLRLLAQYSGFQEEFP